MSKALPTRPRPIFSNHQCLPIWCKEIKSVNPKGNQYWISSGGTDAGAEAPILWPPNVKNWLIRKDPVAGEDWRQEDKGRGWDGCKASLTQWTWVWASSRSWWWTGKPGVLQFTGSKRAGHDWLNWTELNCPSHQEAYISLLASSFKGQKKEEP